MKKKKTWTHTISGKVYALGCEDCMNKKEHEIHNIYPTPIKKSIKAVNKMKENK